MRRLHRAPGSPPGGRGASDSAFHPSAELLDRLNRTARALCGSAEDADDLVQDTFARVLARPRVFHRGDPAPYLMRTLRNTYLTSLRTASRRLRTAMLPVEESGAMESSLARPDLVIEQLEALAAIAGLAPDFRATLVAVDILGLSHREAARALGIREATIATRLFRARQRVVRRLGIDGFDSASGVLKAP